MSVMVVERSDILDAKQFSTSNMWEFFEWLSRAGIRYRYDESNPNFVEIVHEYRPYIIGHGWWVIRGLTDRQGEFRAFVNNETYLRTYIEVQL